MTDKEKYQIVVGLEVHAQLLTQSKLFCGDSAAFSTEPNTHISPLTLGHPGTLPVMNKKAVEYAVKLGLALHCHIEQYNYFARKNYFYPDLPKGYQISQHTTPICKNGFLKIKTAGKEKEILIHRIHLEEDAGKSLHDIDENYTCIDLNRAGVPLLEIVSEPILHSSEEAFAYLTALRRLVRWTGVCDGNMEEGSMRCDANISIRLKGETRLGTRVEIKNLNSIRNVKRAIDYEANRLIELAENKQPIIQETRSFDADTGTTFSLRHKEDADDYRYFPEPDLTALTITQEYIERIKKSLPVLPETMEEKYTTVLKLPDYDVQAICDNKEQADFFESLIQHTTNYKAAANWLLGPVKNYLNDNQINISMFALPPHQIARLIHLTEEGKISFGTASSRIFLELMKDISQDPLQIANSLNLVQESNNMLIESWVEETIAKMPDKVLAYKRGKKGLIALFAGEVKKISQGKADMQLAQKILEQKLNVE